MRKLPNDSVDLLGKHSARIFPKRVMMPCQGSGRMTILYVLRNGKSWGTPSVRREKKETSQGGRGGYRKLEDQQPGEE